MTWEAVIVGCIVTGIITWGIVYHNRKVIKRSNCIDKKNELLRSLERRALYVWSGEKGINLNLERSYLVGDIRRIEDQYKELGKGSGDFIPPDLEKLRDMLEENVEEVLNSPDSPASKKLGSITRDKIRDLTKTLESIPPK